METMRRFFRHVMDKVTGGYFEGESDLPKYNFYDTIEEFGYHFNEKGELLSDDGGRFKFVVRENDRNYNQQHYDALGELITEYLYEKMETDLHLQKLFIPLDAKKEEPQGFIFQSEDAKQCDTLMVIINGGGVVRAGQWSRKLIINEGLEFGSQFPYIRRARDLGFGVMVLNTNQNQQTVNGKATDIRCSSSAEDHGLYVWEHVIRKTKAPNIVIVAHSYGGLVACNMVEHFLEDFKQRVFCIVFTDSIHTVASREQRHEAVKDFLKERAVNFASTYVPLDYMMQASPHSDCLSVSAGTEEHARTSYACMESAFTLIKDNLVTWTADRSMAPRHFKPLPEDLSEFSCAARWQRKMEMAAAQEREKDGSSSVDAAEKDDKPKDQALVAAPPVQSPKKRRASDALEEKEEEEGKAEDGGEEEESVSKAMGGKRQEKKKGELQKDEVAASQCPAKENESRAGHGEGDSKRQKDSASKKQDSSEPVKGENKESQKEDVALSPVKRRDESHGQGEGESKDPREEEEGGGGDALSKNETKKEENKPLKPSCEEQTPFVAMPKTVVPGMHKKNEMEDAADIVVATDTRGSHPTKENQAMAPPTLRENEAEKVKIGRENQGKKEGADGEGDEEEDMLEAGEKESEEAGSGKEEVVRKMADDGKEEEEVVRKTADDGKEEGVRN